MTEANTAQKETFVEIPAERNITEQQNGEQKELEQTKDATSSEKQLKFHRLNWWKRQIAALILGQLLSFCISATGVTSESLATFYQVSLLPK